jgi:methylenetetrahydrofolate--tRNA-(uracil-5-)-methyltransferase
VRVILHEMKPRVFSPAHQLADLAELVCSNSLRSNAPNTPAGHLKEEMRRAGSIVIGSADLYAVPAGQALAVDRILFSRVITGRIESHPRIEVRRGEVRDIPEDGIVVIATGPLTGEALAERIGRLLGRRSLYFYDAISPIVYADTVDFTGLYRASRYGKGDDDYVNILLAGPLRAFVAALVAGETIAPARSRTITSDAPRRVLAARGPETLAHGPMKPIDSSIRAPGSGPTRWSTPPGKQGGRCSRSWV